MAVKLSDLVRRAGGNSFSPHAMSEIGSSNVRVSHYRVTAVNSPIITDTSGNQVNASNLNKGTVYQARLRFDNEGSSYKSAIGSNLNYFTWEAVGDATIDSEHGWYCEFYVTGGGFDEDATGTVRGKMHDQVNTGATNYDTLLSRGVTAPGI